MIFDYIMLDYIIFCHRVFKNVVQMQSSSEKQTGHPLDGK
jgi:hypothetical protein